MSFNSCIDFMEELSPYLHLFGDYKVKDNKLLSCSPFRQEQHPSFVMWLDKGNWKDSGGTERQNGTFIELLSFLSGEDQTTLLTDLHINYARLS